MTKRRKAPALVRTADSGLLRRVNLNQDDCYGMNPADTIVQVLYRLY